MKKKTSVLITFILVVGFMINAVALNSTSVYPGQSKYTVEKGATLTIPFRIQNNTGIMGFKIFVSYPSAVLSNPSTQKGSLLNKGSYMDGIQKDTTSSFSLLWSNSENTYGDGELFVLNFRVKNEASPGDYTIILSYSQDDTFNEQWKDVQLSLQNVVIHINGDENQTSGDGESTTQDEEDKIPSNTEINTNVFARLISWIKEFFSRIAMLFNRMSPNPAN